MEESPPPPREVGKSPIPPGLDPRLRKPEEVPLAPGAVEALEPVDVVVTPSICSCCLDDCLKKEES